MTGKSSARKRSGFTLIELLIVIAIIGILATIVIPKFTGVTDTAKVAKIQTELSTIGTAVEIYRVDHGKYPESLNALVTTEDGKKGYLQFVPEAPAGSSYDTSKLASTGEVTCEFDGVTYSSFGNKK